MGGALKGPAAYHLRLIDSFCLTSPHTTMRRLVAVLLFAALGCSSSGGSNPDGAAGSGGPGGAGGSAGASGAMGSCQAIRLCALDCADDACVASNCLPMGSAAAQAKFQLVRDCTKAAQPAGGGCATPNDINCLCLAQCLQDPPCGELTLDCTANIVDTICDDVCH
jgi:hypothetical protein